MAHKFIWRNILNQTHTRRSTKYRTRTNHSPVRSILKRAWLPMCPKEMWFTTRPLVYPPSNKFTWINWLVDRLFLKMEPRYAEVEIKVGSRMCHFLEPSQKLGQKKLWINGGWSAMELDIFNHLRPTYLFKIPYFCIWHFAEFLRWV